MITYRARACLAPTYTSVAPQVDPHARRAAARTRGVAAGRSAQRGTSGAATGGGGPQAPPTRNSYWAPPTRTRHRALGFTFPTRTPHWLTKTCFRSHF